MMKKLIIINGTMGVGKTLTSKLLYKSLDKSVCLDGDWCWMMNPFKVTEENKKMVEDNIIYLLNNFLKNSSFKYVIFNWVIHKEYIFDIILDKLTEDFELYKISLTCSKDELRKRILKDNRKEEVITKSIERLKNYEDMSTIKIDTTDKLPKEVVKEIIDIVN
ncbi:MAG: nucleotide kinase [Firmicutes bacterium]|nr:nucleotide kinase [Bacillota bacterium]